MKRDMTKEFSSTERRQACAFLTTCCSFPYSIIVDDQKPKTGKDKMGTGSHSGTGGMEVVFMCLRRADAADTVFDWEEIPHV